MAKLYSRRVGDDRSRLEPLVVSNRQDVRRLCYQIFSIDERLFYPMVAIIGLIIFVGLQYGHLGEAMYGGSSKGIKVHAYDMVIKPTGTRAAVKGLRYGSFLINESSTGRSTQSVLSLRLSNKHKSGNESRKVNTNVGSSNPRFFFTKMTFDATEQTPTLKPRRVTQPFKTRRSNVVGNEAVNNTVLNPLVHYIWIHPPNNTFQFHQYVSLLSVHKYIRPSSVYMWCDLEPYGPWWEKAKQYLSSTLVVRRLEVPNLVHGKEIKLVEHKSDVARLLILLKYGGIYIDLDIIVVKEMYHLFRYPVTLGAESPDLLDNGFIIAQRNASFIKLWYDHYKNFSDDKWNEFSGLVPTNLYKNNPELVHVEFTSIFRPSWMERKWLYTPGYLWDWINGNIAIHLYYRSNQVEYNPENIKTLNTTTGEVLRYVFYGDWKIIN